MRRFLVFVLISGLASAANAATVDLVVTVCGSPYGSEVLAIGTVVKVQVVQSGTEILNGGGKLTVDFVGANPAITDTTPVQTFNPGPPASMYGWNWLMNGGVAMLDNGGGSYTAWKSAAANLGVGTPGIGALMDPINTTIYSSTFEFTFEVTAATTLSWGSDTDWHTTGGNLTLGPLPMPYIIPEPMTVALLGLGGLFLRRRK